jgi:3-deoxy-manno-octulosonate cytidylyltransferase (CMP-KDO synthetase)
MIQWVYERARLARTVGRTIVATDDDRIREAVRAFGGEVVMTSPTHASGTDRLAEVAATLDAELIVNVQGDDPLLDPATIDAVVEALISDEGADMATAAVAVSSTEEMLASDVVKVVTDGRGHALYFSRAPIPYARQAPCDARGAAEAAIASGLALRHIGLYAYRKDALIRFASLPPSPLERCECLEQLRALHNGLRVRVVALASENGPAVDTPEDLERIRNILADSSQAERT